MTKVVMIDDKLHVVSENEAEAATLYISQLRSEMEEDASDGLRVNIFERRDLQLAWKTSTAAQKKELTELVVRHIDDVWNNHIRFSKRSDKAKWSDPWGYITVRWVKNISESGILGAEIVAEARKAYEWYTRQQE
ncbi:MAG: hypothetical protein ABF915_10165 [Schleiferilactobacillus harbinensis]